MASKMYPPGPKSFDGKDYTRAEYGWCYTNNAPHDARDRKPSTITISRRIGRPWAFIPATKIEFMTRILTRNRNFTSSLRV